MNKILAIVVGLLIVAVLLLFSMTYTVSYHEVAIRSRFGKIGPESVITEQGLKFKLPIFADKVTKLDTRLQLLESPLVEVQTADNLQLVIKAFMLWKVDTEGSGPLDFYEAYSKVEEAGRRLDGEFRSAVKSSASQFTFGELIGTDSRLTEAEKAIRESMMTAHDRGVQPVSVGISNVLLPATTTRAVLTRMKETRERISEAERGIGASEKDRIEAEAKTRKEKIEAFARNRAAEIRAEGSELAAKYLTDMGRDPGLAIFLSWLDALDMSLSQGTTLVLPWSASPFHLLNLDAPVDAKGIPQPSAELRAFLAPVESDAAPVSRVQGHDTSTEESER